MKKKWLILGIVLVVIVGAIVGYGMIKKGKNNTPKYRFETVSRGDIEATVVTSGTVNPVTVVDVGSQVSGRVAKIYVDFNSPVKAGQIVAELEQDSFIARLQQDEANYRSAVASLDRAKVSLEIAEKKYKRALSLFEKNLISYEEKEAAEANYLNAKSEVLAAEARLEQAKSQLEASRVNLAYTIIRSPVDGVVITRNVNVGQTVAASLQAPVLFKIATDLSKMQVQCSVDEADIGKVKEGQRVRFTVDSYPGETFYGVVRQVRYSPETVQNVVTYTTIVDVDNPDLKLLPGMTANVTITVGEAKGVLRVPNAALRFSPEISQEEMERILKEAREKMMAQFQALRQKAGEGQEQPRFPFAPGEKRGFSQGGPMAQEGQFPSGERRPAGGRQQMSRVWTLDEKGKLWPIFVRPGISDNSFTEIRWGDLKEGQKIIVGYAYPTSTSQSRSQSFGPGPGPGPMMFIRR
ncbi:MAG: efflux RND transporter periplasmic adaptor subunit [Candidatus Aminicenantes bacterium]|nr:efflux RND transporter periplasmic adaptor subunit [Candidatus Aminicenantes bacterium]